MRESLSVLAVTNPNIYLHVRVHTHPPTHTAPGIHESMRNKWPWNSRENSLKFLQYCIESCHGILGILIFHGVMISMPELHKQLRIDFVSCAIHVTINREVDMLLTTAVYHVIFWAMIFSVSKLQTRLLTKLY